ncbi:MAG TPA: LD-carboxypeptidase [Anaerovoracaceae bacterium]|nr:LD-carboxypeptidase [Anaerovoracaceae bacterium]
MIIPKPLKKRDRVAVIAPSSPVLSDKMQQAIESIEFLGLIPVPFPSCYMKNGYLSGSDGARAKDVNDAFADISINGIFCLRGGYGATRILPLLNYEAISKNPKFFAGYSDITALHIVFNKLCNFITYHAPMPSRGYESLDSFSLESLRTAIFKGPIYGSIENPPGEALTTIYPGVGTGRLTGGNLSVIAAALGSPYDIDTKDKIVVIEEVGEPLYSVDRNLTALKLAGKFDKASGIIIGSISDIPTPTDTDNHTMSLQQIMDQILAPLKIPTLYNLRFGHIYPQIIIPLGMNAEINATVGRVALV